MTANRDRLPRRGRDQRRGRDRDQGRDGDQSRDRDQGWGLWPRLALAFGLVVVIAVAGVVLAWPSGGRPGGDRSPAGAARGRGRVADGSPSVKAVLRAGTRVHLPVVDLAGLRWRDFHGVELPISGLAGPWMTRRGLAWGFARTPLGALLATVNIAVRANAQWGPRVFVPTIKGQVTGPGAAALLASCRAAYERGRRAAGVAEDRPLGRVTVAEQAFRWVRYRPGAAVVDIVSVGVAGQGVLVRAVTRIGVRWSHGDWRVLAPPGGDWGNSAAPLRSLRGYTFLPLPAA